MRYGTIYATDTECTSYNEWRASLTGTETSITMTANGATVAADQAFVLHARVSAKRFASRLAAHAAKDALAAATAATAAVQAAKQSS